MKFKTWAEGKIRREVPGLNPLTVSMLLKAEQRTTSSVLRSRSAARTKEAIVAAYYIFCVWELQKMFKSLLTPLS